jgi:hypothetical protein
MNRGQRRRIASMSAAIDAETGQDVLVENKERLDSADLSAAIAGGEVQITEFRMDRVFDDFVVAAVLVLRGERPSPLRALLQFAARDDLDAGHLLGEPCAGLLHSLRSRVDSRLSPNATVHSAE